MTLDSGDRAGVDITLPGLRSPSFRLLLPEAVLASGLEPAEAVHAVPGAWVTAAGGAVQGIVRPRSELACLLRLEPRESGVEIALSIENRSAAIWSDVRVDVCLSHSRPPRDGDAGWSNREFIPGKPVEAGAGDSSIACAYESPDGKAFLYLAWRTAPSRGQAPSAANACLRLRPQVAEALAPAESATLYGAAGIFRGTREELAGHLGRLCQRRPPVDREGRPAIFKRGTLDLDLVETTPLIWKGRPLRFEWVRSGYWNNALHRDHFRFVDRGTPGEPFALDHQFASAFCEGDTVYVTGTTAKRNEVHVFASGDLTTWETWTALARPDYGIFNTSVARAAGEYVLMFEIDGPPAEAGVPFTARFARSRDLRRWELTPPECCYSKDRYTAPHCLRWLEGWFYDFYLEAHQGYEMRVVRSRDLIRWEPSPRNPVLRASAEDKLIADPRLTPEQRKKIAGAKDINNSDIDFCEWNGRLLIDYSWGNQEGTEFLAEASYEGTEADFLRGWFPER